MKLILLFISLCYSLVLTGQCAFDNTFAENATPAICPGSYTATCINGGEYVSVDLISGMEYTFTTCGGSTWDTQLSVYDVTGAVALEYNDDDCGLQSTIVIVAIASVTVHVLLDEYDCQNSGTCADLTITCAAAPPPIVFTSSNLPIVVINTLGGAGIPDDPKIDATMGIIYNGPGVVNNLTDQFNEFEGDIGIERRGSSSGGFPKNQWGLETRDPSGVKVEVSIFNMAYDNDWVLYAPYSDKSLLRNVLSYKMGWDTEQYAPRTKLCEVMLNGSYEGVYVFTEKIKRKDGKVGNNDLEPEDISGNEITGDYILKVDKTTAGNSTIWTSPFPPYFGAPGLINIQAHDPELDSLVPVQMTYIENVVTAFETALAGPNFSDPVLGYAPYIDRGSYIDFMLVNEFGKNVDGYRISTFFHKKRLSDGGELVAGPLWDFNLAWGNANYCDGGNTAGWEIDFYNFCGGGGLQNPFWFERLVEDPAFSHDMNCRWQEMRLGAWHTDTLFAYIDSMAAYLEDAQQRNFQKWQVLGMYLWPNNFIGNTYAEEIAYLKTWVEARATWMDANMFGVCNDLGLSQEENDHYRVFPNPADDFVTIEFPYLVVKAEIVLYGPSGKIVLEKTVNQTYDVQLELWELATGIYHYRIIEPNKRTSTGKLNVH